MSIIRRMRKQKAIWWQRSTVNKYGVFSYHPPVEIDCRWDDTIEEFLDFQGEKRTAKSKVYVDRIIATGDRLKRGVMDSTTPDTPLSFPDAYEVMRFDQTPNIRNTETLLTAYLQ